MPITTLTSREFSQDTVRAKNAAARGPVIVTDRGTPSHVLLSCERYLAPSGGGADIVSLLGMADAGVVSWARSVAASSLYLSVLSVYELELGIQAKERQDLRQGTILLRWLNAPVLASFAGRILALDLDVALRSAALNVPGRVSERDGGLRMWAQERALMGSRPRKPRIAP